MTDLVLVTGATGFITQHCMLQLLEAGYRVRGTARSVERRTEVIDALAPHVSGPSAARLDDLEIVAADLTGDDGWDEATTGCRYVLHVASPVPFTPPADEDEVIAPARDGVRRVLAAAYRAGVERLVLTSSTSAIIYGVARDRVFTEVDWSDVDGPNIGAYDKSKTIAERAAWDLVAELGGGSGGGSGGGAGPELAVVNPGLVLGPLLSEHTSVSAEVVRKIIDRELPAIPNISFAVVDVRDVAAAHLRAMTEPGAAGERFIVAGASHSMRDIAAVLADHLGPRGYRIPTRKLPSWLVRLAARRDATLRLALNDLDVPQSVDASKAAKILDIHPRSMAETVQATADTLIEHGAVK